MKSIAMPEITNGIRAIIPEHLMLSRLAQSEQMREFFIQMRLQNPALAKQGGMQGAKPVVPACGHQCERKFLPQFSRWHDGYKA